MSRSPDIAELLSFVGYDHIVVDMEHSPLDVSSVVSMLRAIDAAAGAAVRTRTRATMPIVRVPTHDDAATTKRILDVLRPPAGIMFPMVETAEQAEAAILSSIYPPYGIRGCAHPFVRASMYGNDQEYFQKNSMSVMDGGHGGNCNGNSVNGDLLRIVQIESKRGIENIPEIGMIDGVDCIFLGPFDISCSIGKMGQFQPEGEVMELIYRAEELVRETSRQKKIKGMNENGETVGNNDENDETETATEGLILGGFRSPGRTLKEMFAEDVGYQLVAGSADLGLIQGAARADFMEAKRAIQSNNSKSKSRLKNQSQKE